MCPSNLATQHPAGDTLQDCATKGCPVKTGRSWTRADIASAVARGAHPMTMEESAMSQFYTEAVDKEERGLVNIKLYNDIKDLPDDEFPGERLASNSRSIICAPVAQG